MHFANKFFDCCPKKPSIFYIKTPIAFCFDYKASFAKTVLVAKVFGLKKEVAVFWWQMEIGFGFPRFKFNKLPKARERIQLSSQVVVLCRNVSGSAF